MNKMLLWSNLQRRGGRLLQSGYLAQFFAGITRAGTYRVLNDICGLRLSCLGELPRRAGRVNVWMLQ